VWRATSAEDDGEKPPAEVAFDGSASALEALSREHALCVTGPALGALEAGGAASALQTLCPRVTIFARVSPAQKETILRALNDAGLCTLMCGDGTNDVSALKQAHVGVSIISNPALEKRIDALRLKQQHAHRTRVQEQVGKLVATGRFSQASAERFLRVNEVVDATADDELGALLSAERVTEAPPPPGPAAIMPAPAASTSGAPTKLSLQESLARRMAELERESAAGGDAGGLAMVSLGDASIASPFTSKQPSPAACLDILRQVGPAGARRGQGRHSDALPVSAPRRVAAPCVRACRAAARS